MSQEVFALRSRRSEAAIAAIGMIVSHACILKYTETGAESCVLIANSPIAEAPAEIAKPDRPAISALIDARMPPAIDRSIAITKVA